MNENALIKDRPASRSPAVTFKAQAGRLVIRVDISVEDAKAIERKAADKTRAKAKASRTILAALRDLVDEEPRDRSGFLQANVPSKLKAELAELAKADGKTLTTLFLDRLSEWVDPNTGRPRTKRQDDDRVYYKWPSNFRRFVRDAGSPYNEAKNAKTLSRLQVDVGPKIADTIAGRLAGSRVSKGLFLTALGIAIVKRHKGE